MTAYHFVAASERFLTVEEPLEEVLRERTAELCAKMARPLTSGW